jgi:hypothetical protein
MSIRRGEDWGRPGRLAGNAPVAGSDREVAELLRHWLEAGGSGPFEVGLLAGDLHRTLGGARRSEADLRAGRAVRYPCDAMEVVHDDGAGPRRRLAVAHVQARGRRLFASRTVLVMNAAFIGPLDLGPRAHPGDGLLDVTDGAVGRGEVRRARQRATTGTHVPHPGLSERRVPAYEAVADPGRTWRLVVDGVEVGRTRQVRVTVLPEALLVVA